MAETIVGGKWHWYQLPEDLKQQAGYEGVSIDPLSVRPTSCAGETVEGNKFTVTWVRDCLMMISLLRDEPELIEAFATVVEYRPLCKYRHKLTEQFTTYTWDKEDPEVLFGSLQQDPDVMDLQLLKEAVENANGDKEKEPCPQKAK